MEDKKRSVKWQCATDNTAVGTPAAHVEGARQIAQMGEQIRRGPYLEGAKGRRSKRLKSDSKATPNPLATTPQFRNETARHGRASRAKTY
jgi:hypothetical protein